MKIIFLLVLVGPILAEEGEDGETWEEIDCDETPTPKDDHECVFEALSKFPDFVETFLTYLCDYKGLFDDNRKNYDKTAADLIEMLACSGCSADSFLGEGKTFEEVLGNLGVFIKEMGVPVGRIADALDFTQPLTDLFCYVFRAGLSSECFKDIFKDIPKLMDTLEPLFCQKGLDEFTLDELLQFMSDLGCVGDKVARTGDTLKNLPPALLDAMKARLVEFFTELQDILVQKGVLSSEGCVVVKPVDGNNPVVNLDGGLDGLLHPLIGGLTNGLTNGAGVLSGLTSGPQG